MLLSALTHQTIIKRGKNGGERMEAFDKSFVYCKNDDLEYGNNVCYVIVFLFFIIFLFLGSFRDTALAFHFRRTIEKIEREIFLSRKE